ncbi:MAG: hypothetical protein RR902_00725 [Oscillospiraceae bacterium]
MIQDNIQAKLKAANDCRLLQLKKRQKNNPSTFACREVAGNNISNHYSHNTTKKEVLQYAK